MALTYGFFNSLNHDRTYSAEDFGRLFKGIITDGIFGDLDEEFVVTASEEGLMVFVGSGKAWFNNTWTYNDYTYPLVLDASSNNLNRIDAIVLEVNKQTRLNSIKIVKGESLPDAVRPTLTLDDDNQIWQYALAYISVPANTETITTELIENVVGNLETPYVSGEVNQLPVEDLISRWEDDFAEHFEDWKVDNITDFNTFFDTIVNHLTSSQIGTLEAAITTKEEAPTIPLTKTLAAGATAIYFEDASIKDDSIIDVYTDPYGRILVDATANEAEHKVYLTFRPASTSTTVKILVRNP